MEKALNTFQDNVSVEYRMWRTCAVKIAKTVLGNNSQYDDWSQSQIMMHLEKAFLPDIRTITCFPIESDLNDVILIQGKAVDGHTGEIFTAVSYIPRTVSALKFEEFQMVRPLLVVVGGQEEENLQIDRAVKRDRWSIMQQSGSSRCLMHHIRHSNSFRDQSPVKELIRENSITSWTESVQNYYQRKNSVHNVSDNPVPIVPQRRDGRTGLRTLPEFYNTHQFPLVHAQITDLPINKHMSRILEDTGSTPSLNSSTSTVCTDLGNEIAINIGSENDSELTDKVLHLEPCTCKPYCSEKHGTDSSSL